MKYSEKLIRIRVTLSMSQEELAKELGVSFATVNRWENEHVVPSRRYAFAIDEYCKKNNIAVEDK